MSKKRVFQYAVFLCLALAAVFPASARAQEEDADSAITEEVVIDLGEEDIAPTEGAPEISRSLFFTDKELAGDAKPADGQKSPER